MSTTVLNLAKRGPGPDNFGEAKNESQLKTFIKSIHTLYAEQPDRGATFTKRMNGTSAEAVFTTTLQATLSNTSEVEQHNETWRVSIGCSGYHGRRVKYTPTASKGTHNHSWGDFSDRIDAASTIACLYMGTRTVDISRVGYPNVELTYSQRQNSALSLMDSMAFMDGCHVNTTAVWHRIWYNAAQIALTKLRGDGYDDPHWAQRPTEATCEVIIGSHLVVEIDSGEKDLIPYITFLLGAGPHTFSWQWGSRTPHLCSKYPVDIRFSFLIRDDLNAAPVYAPEGFCYAQAYAQAPANVALPGLPSYGNTQRHTGKLVGEFDMQLIDRALEVLARTMPVESDMEAGLIKACADIFAEPFRGVGIDEVCGMNNDRNAQYNAFLDEGDTEMPSGSLACCFGTRISESSATVRNARSNVLQCSNLISTLGGARIVAEAFVLALQLGCRQLGITVPMAFPGVAPGEIYHERVPLPHNPSVSFGDLLAFSTNSSKDEPSEVLLTTSMMMEVMYNAVLPESALYFEFGNRNPKARCPLMGEANLGECLTSVHAAQVLTGLLQESAVGLAGIPNKMDVMAAEIPIALAADAGVHVVMGTSNSELVEHKAEVLPGVNMLGHAVIMMRDDNLRIGDRFEVDVARFKTHKADREYTESFGVPMNVCTRLAFMQSSAAAESAVHLKVMALYADFDKQRFADLRLRLPNTARGNSYLTDSAARTRVPGFVAAAIGAAFDATTGPAFEATTGHSAVGLPLVQHSRKRARPGTFEVGGVSDSGPAAGEVGVSGLTAEEVSDSGPAAEDECEFTFVDVGCELC